MQLISSLVKGRRLIALFKLDWMIMINGGTGLKHELNLIEVMVFEGSFLLLLFYV